MSLEPPKFSLVDEKTNEKLLNLFHGERTGFVQVGDKKWVFPHRYAEDGKHFYNFKARPDDTWVLTFPRSGTTWVQELVWMICNDLDYETANTVELWARFPFLEFSMFNHPEVTREFCEANKGDPEKVALCEMVAKNGYEVLAGLPSPRFIKSHFPFSLLPSVLDSGCKIVYVARNPKDVAVSWFHLNKLFKTQGYTGDFATFWNLFRNDLIAWSPYWEHLKEAWAKRDDPNVLFLFYEDMIQDLPNNIEKVATFFGKNLNEEQVSRLADHLNIKNFKHNPMVNMNTFVECGIVTSSSFVRVGAAGRWGNMFTSELEAEADEWIAENLKGTDFSFPFLNNNNKC